jgi:hypothetical protein
MISELGHCTIQIRTIAVKYGQRVAQAIVDKMEALSEERERALSNFAQYAPSLRAYLRHVR